MNGNCDVCLLDGDARPAERLAVSLIYPHPWYGPTPMVFDLCESHLSMAHDPTNTIRVVS